MSEVWAVIDTKGGGAEFIFATRKEAELVAKRANKELGATSTPPTTSFACQW